MVLPLHDIRVLDFSTLLPGPLASLILAEAGAEVIKVERPGTGEDMRGYPPRLGDESGSFALLNRGKRSIAMDLRAPGAAASLLALAPTVDIVLEQFRPGVMERLGLGYEAWREANPGILYCAITGYGQTGPRAREAGHDMNYQAGAGLLALTAGADGMPGIPPTLAGDLAGGTWPAVVNLLLALRRRDRTGEGCFIDIAIAENLFTFQFMGLAMGHGAGLWPRPGGETLTGGSPRYRIYRTGDGRHLAVAPLEDKFWQAFCAIAGVPEALRDDARDPRATIEAVAACVAAHDAAWWESALAGRDTCCTVVRTLEEAVRDIHFQARGVFARQVEVPGHVLPALPIPIVPALRAPAARAPAPRVGQDNGAIIRGSNP
ncbi:L-carnitine dehydratase/bile acid-inducible protein F [sediment metagenome]|uniref:L-carnitine dehydratase/bile acid-inducible protein F n=1 Tax=sediment metagenome TaxID=749907 RepID=D9PK86_9ZZZZ